MVRDPRHAVAMRNVALVGVLVVTTAVGGATAQPAGHRPGAGAASAPPAPAVVLASVAQHYANATGEVLTGPLAGICLGCRQVAC